jgi:transaldolase
VASVASFFVSRVDVAVDRALRELGSPAALALLGRIGIANSKAAYRDFGQIFSGPRWQDLLDRGARVQRPLWASTGTKDPERRDTLYVDALIGPDTVNTVPPATLDAFLDHGAVGPSLGEGLEAAEGQLSELAALGVDLDAITETLERQGVESFSQSYRSLLAIVAARRR